MPVTITEKSHLDRQVAEAQKRPGSSGLIVIDFFATWCGPCKQIGPLFDKLDQVHPDVTFLRVDVDQSEALTVQFEVRQMPNFVFLRDGKLIDRVVGADIKTLTDKIALHTKGSGGSTKSSPAASQSAPGSSSSRPDLLSMIDMSQTECLNEDDAHPLSSILNAEVSPEAFLCSDTDAELIIFITFTQFVKIKALQINAPEDSGPRTVKLFINQSSTPDFSSCESGEPVQQLDIQPKDLLDGAIIPLNFVKFQKVTTLTLFVADNQKGTDVTRIDKLRMIGMPTNTTNMKDFKRVSGKAGEAHS